ncbi:hypothetical protein Tsubulata_041113 [Turnera subulata]|uniref:FAR1 domain-containing protein n=1 Tax=Turnera subulata TaxID=218843 RepID=A0A9Q0GL00_9ROSI|nr:hypothetical protein Tsubulata_041113 [Turnera subulata]
MVEIKDADEYSGDNDASSDDKSLNEKRTDDVVIEDERMDDQVKDVDKLTVDDVMGLEFDSEEEAYEFYGKYSRCIGFTIRKDVVKRDFSGKIVKRTFVCSNAGLRDPKHLSMKNRKRDHRALTRSRCGARLRITKDPGFNKWKVLKFNEEHNHDLIPFNVVHLMRGNRKLSDPQKAQVDSMHSVGVRSCHIMGFMVGQSGGYNRVGF